MSGWACDHVCRERGGIRISERESGLLTLVCRGCSNAEIARTLNLSAATVRGYLTGLYTRFAVTSRTGLATRAIFLGLVDASVWPPVATARRHVPLAAVLGTGVVDLAEERVQRATGSKPAATHVASGSDPPTGMTACPPPFTSPPTSRTG